MITRPLPPSPPLHRHLHSPRLLHCPILPSTTMVPPVLPRVHTSHLFDSHYDRPHLRPRPTSSLLLCLDDGHVLYKNGIDTTSSSTYPSLCCHRYRVNVNATSPNAWAINSTRKRSIEELKAPDFKRNHSTDLIRQRAVEKECSREASQNAKLGTIKCMQFTLSKPDLKPSPEFNKRTRAAAACAQVDDSTSGPAAPADEHGDMNVVEDDANDKDPPRTSQTTSASMTSYVHHSLKFDSFFSIDLGPTAFLFAQHALTNSMNYGGGLNPCAANDSFCISRPTIELLLDDILHSMEADSPPMHSAHLSRDQHLNVAMIFLCPCPPLFLPPRLAISYTHRLDVDATSTTTTPLHANHWETPLRCCGFDVTVIVHCSLWSFLLVVLSPSSSPPLLIVFRPFLWFLSPALALRSALHLYHH
ncbi:hypothetical protein BDQ17DRAFT_1353603 [Cyathus striatus]|nr:hypothetical protein BDQ17DRAFT_1353603 [Cyathus striatus]